MRLVEPITNTGHHVYMDNFYTLPQLFRDLRANGCGVCGTLRMNRCGLPPSIKENMRKGERKAVRLDKLLLAIWWIDKPTVTVLATIHDNSVVTVESRHVAESIEKPLAVAEYNKYLGGSSVLPAYCIPH